MISFEENLIEIRETNCKLSKISQIFILSKSGIFLTSILCWKICKNIEPFLSYFKVLALFGQHSFRVICPYPLACPCMDPIGPTPPPLTKHSFPSAALFIFAVVNSQPAHYWDLSLNFLVKHNTREKHINFRFDAFSHKIKITKI